MNARRVGVEKGSRFRSLRAAKQLKNSNAEEWFSIEAFRLITSPASTRSDSGARFDGHGRAQSLRKRTITAFNTCSNQDAPSSRRS